MDRKKFLKNIGIGVVATPILGALIACASNSEKTKDSSNESTNDCETTPREMIGPFPLKSPADFVRANIVGDRDGVPLIVNLTIQDVNKNCTSLPDVYIDIWQCDSKGNYSEYSRQLDGNFTNKHFLRGRQTTNKEGKVSFISLYPGRAPHLHIEVLHKNGKSLLATQIAFPDNISNSVYSNTEYNGKFDTSNKRDGLFRNSLDGNMADAVTGNNAEGYTLNKIIKIAV